MSTCNAFLLRAVASELHFWILGGSVFRLNERSSGLSFVRFGFFASVCVSLMCSQYACSGGPQTEATSNDGGVVETIYIEKKAVLKPESIKVLNLKTTPCSLPAALKGDETLSIGVLDPIGTLAGGQAGLFRYDKEKGIFSSISTEPVMGIVPWGTDRLVVVRPNVIQLWDGTLQATDLASQLEGAPILSVFGRSKDEIWIGTNKKLWQLKGEQLSSFVEKGIRWMRGLQGGKSIVLQDTDGKFSVLKEVDGAWTLRSLADENQSLDWVLPLEDDQLWGIFNGQLFLRKVEGDQASWWPYLLDPDDKNEEKVPLKMLRLMPAAKQIWVFTGADLYRIEKETVSRQSAFDGVGTIDTAVVASDGALWLSGEKCVRVGDESEALTYTKHVEPFIRLNCTRCHTDKGGVAFPLDTYEQVKEAMEPTKPNQRNLVDVILDGSMPSDRKPLVGGDAELLKVWKAGGYQK